MKAHEVDKALRQKFVVDGERLVFWHDDDAEFADYVAGELSEDLGGAQLLDVAKVGGLAAKLKLETTDPAKIDQQYAPDGSVSIPDLCNHPRRPER